MRLARAIPIAVFGPPSTRIWFRYATQRKFPDETMIISDDPGLFDWFTVGTVGPLVIKGPKGGMPRVAARLVVRAQAGDRTILVFRNEKNGRFCG